MNSAELFETQLQIDELSSNHKDARAFLDKSGKDAIIFTQKLDAQYTPGRVFFALPRNIDFLHSFKYRDLHRSNITKVQVLMRGDGEDAFKVLFELPPDDMPQDGDIDSKWIVFVNVYRSNYNAKNTYGILLSRDSFYSTEVDMVARCILMTPAKLKSIMTPAEVPALTAAEAVISGDAASVDASVDTTVDATVDASGESSVPTVASTPVEPSESVSSTDSAVQDAVANNTSEPAATNKPRRMGRYKRQPAA